MKNLFFVLVLTALVYSCSEEKQTIPEAPETKGAVYKILSGKKYKTIKAGLLSVFKMDKDNPYQWFDNIKDTSSFFRDFRNERMKFSLTFLNDTALEISDEKIIKATWHVDDHTDEEEVPGIRLKFSYEDDNMNLFPGQVGPSIITASFRVLGIDEKLLMLETPRSFNRSRVFVLMQSE